MNFIKGIRFVIFAPVILVLLGLSWGLLQYSQKVGSRPADTAIYRMFNSLDSMWIIMGAANLIIIAAWLGGGF